MANIITSLDGLALAGSWVAIGSFDGVHAGHRALLSALVAGAHAQNLPAVVVTFFPHPVAFLRKLQGPFYLTPPAERASLLADLGVDWVITLPFDAALAAYPARDFMLLLRGALGLRCLVAGETFALGKNREGNLARLAALGQELGYTVQIVPPTYVQDVMISSSQVRAWLAEGQLAQVTGGLTRPYRVAGEVVHGDGRGAGIGIPTANLRPWPEQIIPAPGVYAGYTTAGAARCLGVTNIGIRPTFDNPVPQTRIETHLLDFPTPGAPADLYGQTIQVEFAARLRAEQRFASVDALIAQIHADIRTARTLLGGSHAGNTQP